MTTKKQKLIYLAAASHSGSTMTAMLLGAHPDLCSVGELKAINLGDKNSYLCLVKHLQKTVIFGEESQIKWHQEDMIFAFRMQELIYDLVQHLLCGAY